MDPDVIATLEAAGVVRPASCEFPEIPIQVDGDVRAIAAGEEVATQWGKAVVLLRLRWISELCVGSRQPPEFPAGPTPEYFPFFLILERTAAGFCRATGTRVSDQEFEALYDHLRRRPDGSHENPLFSYLRAAARLHMSLHDTSRAELEGVLRRLARSARRYSVGYNSTNYSEQALDRIV